MWGWCAFIQDFWVQGGTRGAMSGQKLFLRLCDAAGGAVALAGWKVEGLGKEVVVACLPSRLENIPRASLGRWWQSTFHWLCASPWWSSCFCPSRRMGKSDQQACARFSSEHEPVVWRRGGRTGKQRGRGGTSPKGFSEKGGQQQFSPDCCRAFSRWTWIFLRNRKQTPRRSQRQRRRRKWSVAGAWLEEFFCAEARGEGGGQRFQEERGPSAVESYVQDVGAHGEIRVQERQKEEGCRRALGSPWWLRFRQRRRKRNLLLRRNEGHEQCPQAVPSSSTMAVRFAGVLCCTE